MFEGIIAAKLAHKGFQEDVFKVIKRHATWGAILMMLPDFGFGGIIFIYVLWHMYGALCEKVGISFSENRSKLIGIGFAVNIAVAFILDIFLTAFFFIEPFILYFQFYLSGKFFVESLKKIK